MNRERIESATEKLPATLLRRHVPDDKATLRVESRQFQICASALRYRQPMHAHDLQQVRTARLRASRRGYRVERRLSVHELSFGLSLDRIAQVHIVHRCYWNQGAPLH